MNKNHCCTPTNQCGENEGDCDNNEDCHGNLICGSNNWFIRSASGAVLWSASKLINTVLCISLETLIVTY